MLAGKDKGKTGKVVKTLPGEEKVIVEGVNVATRHTKSRRVRSQGQVIEKSMPVHVSSVALMDGKKAARIGYMREGEGKDKKKVRVLRPSGKKV